MEYKFADDEIVKALECCSKDSMLNCRNCPYEESCNMGRSDMQKDALDLINRQKAEIERLNHIRAELSKENDALKEEKDNLIKTYKECMTEAIKEFAERLKEEIRDACFAYEAESQCEYIDNLVKEMTGEDNGN